MPSGQSTDSGIGPSDPKAGRRPPQIRTSPIKAYGSSRLRIRPQGCPSLSVRRTIPGSGPRCVSGDGPVVPISSFATRGLLWVSYPAFKRYYEDAKTASARLLRLRIPLGVRYLGCFHFLNDHGRKARPCSWSLLCRCGPFRLCPRRQEALPASLKTPLSLCPALRPRADLHARPLSALRCCPRYFKHEGSPIQNTFEAQSHGFTARCLRLKASFLSANQGSLPVGGQSFPGGSDPARSQ